MTVGPSTVAVFPGDKSRPATSDAAAAVNQMLALDAQAKSRVAACLEVAQRNRLSIQENAQIVHERRHKIEANRKPDEVWESIDAVL